jgi:ABC-type transport system involved in multi-copper enzyme maturation permease subunit
MNAIRSEIKKLTTVKSTWILILLAVVLPAGLTAMMTANDAGAITSGGAVTIEEVPVHHDFGWADVMPLGTMLPQLILGLLAILLVVSEYTYGTIQPTLLATPKRIKVLLSKLLVVFIASAVLLAISLILSFVVSFFIQNGKYPEPSFATAFTTGISGLGSAALACGLWAAFCIGISFIVRNSTGSIFTMIGFIVVPSILTSMAASAPIILDIIKWLPNGVYQGATFGDLPATIGLAVWAVVSLAVGYTLFKKKDA